jgi:hypothetical protein
MTFRETQHKVETARAGLVRAQADAAGWADQKRQQFDAQRIKPLANAAVKLTTALQCAREAETAAERLMSD